MTFPEALFFVFLPAAVVIWIAVGEMRRRNGRRK